MDLKSKKYSVSSPKGQHPSSHFKLQPKMIFQLHKIQLVLQGEELNFMAFLISQQHGIWQSHVTEQNSEFYSQLFYWFRSLGKITRVLYSYASVPLGLEVEDGGEGALGQEEKGFCVNPAINNQGYHIGLEMTYTNRNWQQVWYT